ncbi:MAG: helix-turn-helix domain-containing protein [Deltaproteobacteria bacterium]|nr:helix-turn-helix domain-containing protein [Deltaproteobacteria bacterium]
MSRPLRVEFPGAVYHVTSRGDRREAIYEDEMDRRGFLEIVGQVVDRFGWRCHAYCLMDNHYHLLIETPEANLARGMRQLNGMYTQRFNRRHGRVGHVFQGRYKTIIVQKDGHLLELCRYVVLNPVRAGLVKTARAWPWSSYRVTIGQRSESHWVTTDWLLAQFGQRRAAAVREYQQFVTEGLGQQPWKELTRQVYYGDEQFITDLRQPPLHPEVPRRQRQPVRPPLSQLVTVDTAEAIGRAYRDHGYRLAEIAQHLGIHYATVSRRLKQFEQTPHK